MTPKKIIQYVILSICVIIIIDHFIKHKNELTILNSFQTLDIILILLMYTVIHFINAYRMLFILKNIGLKEINDWQWLKIFTISRFINAHIPQGAHVYRTLKLKKDFAFTYTQSFGMVTFITWFELISTLLIAAFLVFIFNRNIVLFNFNVLNIIVVILFFVIIAPFLINKLLYKREYSNLTLNWIHNKVSELFTYVTKSSKDYKLLTHISILTLGNFLACAIAIYAFFKALSLHLNFSEVSLFTAITLLSGNINITPNNMGITELIYGQLTKSIGSTLSVGIIACGGLRLLMYLLTALLALFFKLLIPDTKK